MYEVKRYTRLLAICATALLAVVGAYGQTVTGSIRGTVADPSGAAVAGAQVTATNVATGVKTSTTSDRSGTYNIQTLAIGN